MMWFFVLLGASVISSIFVLAAGILSSRVNRQEDLVESFYKEVPERAVSTQAQTAE